jgi:hypothetical protein
MHNVHQNEEEKKGREYLSLWDLKRSRIWSHSMTCSTRLQFPSFPNIWITLNIEWSEYLILALRIVLANIHSGMSMSAPFNLLKKATLTSTRITTIPN